mmetsp:Transcript_669/g.1404  ORF Transcript_669/g.1404 Transcript_669/m.1404 type:complete len:265 (-) Transcript_669:64-858(-)
MLDIVNVQRGDKVLDIGCGTGTLAILAADRALVGATSGTRSTKSNTDDDEKQGLVVGVDPGYNLLKRAEKKARKHYVNKRTMTDVPPTLEFRQGLAEAIPADSDTFDVVLFTFTLHHLPGDDLQNRVLNEIKRVMVPGGRLLIVDFAGGHNGHHGHHKSQQVVNVDTDPAAIAARKAKFENVEVQKVEMMGAVAVLAKKPMSKGAFLASLKSNVIMGEKEQQRASKGQVVASMESDLIMGKDDDPEHKKLSKGEYLASLPSEVM